MREIVSKMNIGEPGSQRHGVDEHFRALEWQHHMCEVWANDLGAIRRTA